ncbi:MAG: tRNA pseudouridine(38-40) synthase TruA [Candidatus Dormibacteraeota bacterium]|nr:tRNA pseudouridine(38-40) synthase TruA [Candidatus Dormibacteraeota bacterium]
MFRNIKLLIEYDGREFSGWQQQRGLRTVEAELKKAVGDLVRHDVTLYAAGRTDAGAHAEGQVANFHYAGPLAPDRLASALNVRLPSDVAILEAREVSPEFHARYSARWRRYRYRYLDRQVRPVLALGRCWHIRNPLDVTAMAEAAAVLVGRHDWSTFCAASEPAEGRVRTMQSAQVRRSREFVELELVGEGFLRGLVRGIAGGLAEVGLGRQAAGWVGGLLEARDRRLAPRSAPAAGLTLVEVIY